MKPKTSSSRVEKMRAARKAKGHIRREYYATPEEHAQLADHLKTMRGETNG